MMLILEVMDKVPGLRTVWGAALLLGLVGFVAARFRRWLILPALTVIGVLAYWQLSELADAAVRPAIIQEAGRGYLIQSCAAVAVAVLLSVLGLVPWRARDFVHFQLRGRGGRPQLKRDSLGGGGCPRCTLATGWERWPS